MYAEATALFYCSSFWYPVSSRSLKVAYIWQIERVQKDSKLNFLATFSLPSLLKKIGAWGTAPSFSHRYKP